VPETASQPGGNHHQPSTPSIGASVGANYRAVCRARSTADFIAKLGIVLEEADETLFWIELLVESGAAHTEKTASASREANELVSIFVASLRTAKGLKSAI
jgi:four helix bundle protein